MQRASGHIQGTNTFLIIWSGQFASRIGTALTRFALLIWAYDQTGSATSVALLGFFAFLPTLVVSPFAGVWVDRLDRRRVMLLADLGAGLMTFGLLGLYSAGELQLWHLYTALLLAGAFESFQHPAYTAATTLLLPKEQYGRAMGLRSLAENGAYMLAPVLAGLLLVWLGIAGVMLVDLLTFGLAMITLLAVRIPRPPRAAGDAGPNSYRRELAGGFQYLWARPGLLGLTLIFTGMNFFAAITYYSTLPALILTRSGGNELALASVQAAIGAAGVAGAVGVSLWGGPARKIHGVLLGAALSFLFGDLIMAVGRSLPAWVAGALISAAFVPLIGSSNEPIWQAKVEPGFQGRVFAARSMLGQFLSPLGYLMGGILADHFFEPAMMPGGALVDSFGWLVGTGPGAGIAFMFACTSLLGAAMGLSGYLVPAVRNVENDLPDHEFTDGLNLSVQSA